jgi:hypothetical protein
MKGSHEFYPKNSIQNKYTSFFIMNLEKKNNTKIKQENTHSIG